MFNPKLHVVGLKTHPINPAPQNVRPNYPEAIISLKDSGNRQPDGLQTFNGAQR